MVFYEVHTAPRSLPSLPLPYTINLKELSMLSGGLLSVSEGLSESFLSIS